MSKIAILGGGNLGCSLADGILAAKKVAPENLFVTRNNIDKIKYLSDAGVNVIQDNKIAVQESDMIVLALKPFKIKEVLEEIKPFLTRDKILVSVATGISILSIEEIVRDNAMVFRAMPNTAAAVSESITCICGNSDRGRAEVASVFEGIGETVFINEELMDAATVIGACGIAYVLRFIRAMIQGGIEIGFDSNTATKIVTQTVKGAADLLIERNTHPEQEIDKVTTPKGCTIAGLNEMEHQGFSSALIQGIKTSYEKI